MGKVGLVLSKVNKEFIHTHATSDIPEGQIIGKDGLPWCDSSENLLFGCF